MSGTARGSTGTGHTAALLAASAVWFPAERFAAELAAAGFPHPARLAGLAGSEPQRAGALALQARFEHGLGGALGARRARPKE